MVKDNFPVKIFELMLTFLDVESLPYVKLILFLSKKIQYILLFSGLMLFGYISSTV